MKKMETKLRAENKRLASKLKRVADDLFAARHALLVAGMDREKLREALEPFAALTVEYELGDEDMADVPIRYADLRRARRVFKEVTAPEKAKRKLKIHRGTGGK